LNKGFHASDEVTGQKCFNCHGEHFGRDFEIIRFEKDKFNHDDTGYKLIGAHKDQKCENCHKPDNISDPELKKREGSFLGLNTACITCHADYHKDQLTNNCESCHNNDSFKPASKFSHDKAKFQLTGAHKKVDCEKCHKIEGSGENKFQHFSGLVFASCINCHEDKHNGKFGANCEKCHSTTSFKLIKNMETFDHSVTNFPLVGRHEVVDCITCHGNNLSSKPKHDKCIDCHKDYHEGKFVKDRILQDCADCHNVQGFSPSLFSIEKHSKLKFPLAGSHLAVPCFMCHKTETGWNFNFDELKCVKCHDNPHGNSISEKFFGNSRCENCHNENTWKSIKFDHSGTGFILAGKHETAFCSDCHIENSDGVKKHKFSGLGKNCQTCHKDNHAGQFLVEGVTSCENCHGFNDWKASKFNHKTTKFKLEGAHEKVPCSLCHKETTKEGIQFILYKIEDYRCESCHSS